MDRASFLPIVAKAARKALMNFFFIFVLCSLFFAKVSHCQGLRAKSARKNAIGDAFLDVGQENRFPKASKCKVLLPF